MDDGLRAFSTVSAWVLGKKRGNKAVLARLLGLNGEAKPSILAAVARSIDQGRVRFAMEEAGQDELQSVLARLKQEHRDLDSAINALEESGKADQLQVKRLKKKKLCLKDEIARIEDQLLPDIIA